MTMIESMVGKSGRKAFKATALGFAVIPLLRGGSGVLFGARNVPDDASIVNETVDSEYRFAHALWFAAAPALWWVTRDVDRRVDVMTGIAAAIALGGVGRSIAWTASGRPDHVFVTAIPLEVIGLPALAWWHRLLAQEACAAAVEENQNSGVAACG